MAVNPGQELSSINFRDMIGGPLRAVVEAQAAAAISTVNFIKDVGFEKAPNADGVLQETGKPVYVTFRYPKEVAPYQPAVTTVPSSFSLDVTDGGSGYTANATNIAVTVTRGPGDTTGTGASGLATADSAGKIVSIAVTPGTQYTKPPTATVAAPTAGATTDRKATVSVSGFEAYVAPQASAPATFQEMKLEVPLLTIVPIPYLRVEETTIKFNAKINSMTYEKTSTDARVDAKLNVSAGWGWGRASLSVSASYQKKTESSEEVQRTYSLDIYVRAVQDEMPGGMEKILGILEDAIRSQPTSVAPPVPITA